MDGESVESSVSATSSRATLPISTAVSLLLVACLTIMVGCVVVPGLPAIARALGVANYSSWLVTTPSLGVVVFGPFAGRIVGRMGLHRALCVGLFLYGLLGVCGMFMVGTTAVFADRLLLGGTTALVMSAGTGLISALYEGRDRLVMIARQGMAIEIGGVIFLAVGGMLASLGWRLPFLLYLVAWAFLVLVCLFVPVVPAKERPVDGRGLSLSGELKLIYLVATAAMAVFFSAVIALPLRLTELAFNETQTGYFLSFVSFVAVVAAACMPRITAKIGEFRTLCVAFLLYAGAHVLFATSGETAGFLAGGSALGLGFGLSVPLVNHMTVEKCHAAQRASALAFLSMAIFAGQFLPSLVAIASHDPQKTFLSAATIAVCAMLAMAIGHRRL